MSCPLIGSLSSSKQLPDFGDPGFVLLKLCYLYSRTTKITSSSLCCISTAPHFGHGAPLNYFLWGRRTVRDPRTIVHQTEPRAQPTSLDPRTLRTAHKVREISCSSLANRSFQFRLISNQGLYIIKVSSVWLDTFFCWIFCWSVKHIMAKNGPSNNEIPPYQGARPKVKYMAHVSQNSLNYICTLKVNW